MARRPSAWSGEGRITSLDLLKALAIVLMVLGHVVQGLQAAGVSPRGGLWSEIVAWIYRFHMQGFFFASGAVLALRPPPSFGALLRYRAATLYYPHVLWGFFYYGIAVLFARYANSPIQDPGNLPLQVERILSGQLSWFLPTLFAATLLTWPLVERRPAIALAAAVALAAWPLVSGIVVLDGTARYGVYLVLGYLAVGGLRRLEAARWGVALFAGGLLLLLALYAIPSAPPDSSVQARLVALGLAVLGISGLLGLCTALSRVGWVARPLALVGQASLIIFLVHPMATAGTRALLLDLVPRWSLGFYLLTISLAGVAIPLLALAVIRRLRLNWLLAWPLAGSPRAVPRQERL